MWEFPDAVAPFSGGLTPGPRTVGGVAYHYVLDFGNYWLASLASSKMLVLGNAQLFVTGTITMAGNSSIIIAPGATLKLFAGNNVQLGGNGDGAADEDFVGAAILRSITLNGHWRIHFDEALLRNGPSF